MTTTYRIETRDGRVIERRSEARYVAAAVREGGAVTFHRTREAARTAAGRFGYVVPIEAPETAAPAAVEAFIVTTADGHEVRVEGEAHPVRAIRSVPGGRSARKA